MKALIIVLGFLISSLTGFSQEKGTFKDPRDGKEYQTIIIGTQTWLAENLAFKPAKGNYWTYDNDIRNLLKFGYLYDWETAKSIAPTGWHLPTKAEWETLFKFLGGDDKKVYSLMKEGGESGFNILIIGWRDEKGLFHAGKGGDFWSSTGDGSVGWHFNIPENDTFLSYYYGVLNGFSVRLLKDK